MADTSMGYMIVFGEGPTFSSAIKNLQAEVNNALGITSTRDELWLPSGSHVVTRDGERFYISQALERAHEEVEDKDDAE